MKTKMTTIKVITIVASILIPLAAIIGIICASNSNSTRAETMQLDELKNGIYAIYYTTHSSVPSQNYEVVTLNCNGNIQTFKGKVTISYTNYSPYAEINSYPYLVNADEIHIYVPQGSVEYQMGVNISK